jgi:Tfp pilus assembly protein PilF
MKKLFTKKEVFKVKSLPYDPDTMAEPTTPEEYRQRGTAFFARKDYRAAVADLKEAISLESNSIDAFYMLGMVHKALQQNDEAVAAFTQVLVLIKAQPVGDKVKNDMLHRLALGHINSITQGDWNLEKEIWKRKS